MTCETITMPGGGHAIVCHRHRARRCACGRTATLLCDWKGARRRRTCDRPICPACAISPSPGRDLCPAHAEEFARLTAATLPGIAGTNEHLLGQGDLPLAERPR